MKNYDQVKKSIDSKILSIVLYIVVVILSVSFVVQAINGAKLDDFFGYTLRIVVSGSMEPEIQINSINIIKICDVEDIEVKDIICFNYNQDIVHRVIDKVTTDSGVEVLHTKGDANEFADSVNVTSDELVGKVVKTLNWVAPVITKYSITPGNIDSAALARNIMIQGIIVGFIVYLIALLVHCILEFSKALHKCKDMNRIMDTYIDDIDELILYRDLMKSIIRADNNEKETLGDKIAKAYLINSCNTLHTELQSFKKDVKQSLFIQSLLKTFENKEDTKTDGSEKD